MTTRSDHPRRSAEAGPFSRPLNVDDVPDDGVDLSIQADAAERVEVARDIGLPAIASLTATFHAGRRAGGRLDVDGTVTARIVQICVVSLEPFESEVEQPVEISFAPSRDDSGDRDGNTRQGRRRHAEVREPPPTPPAIDVHEEDPPDPIIAGRVDLGAVAVEFLTLGLDPYPKKPGIHFSATVVGETDLPNASAFAALARLRDRS